MPFLLLILTFCLTFAAEKEKAEENEPLGEGVQKVRITIKIKERVKR